MPTLDWIGKQAVVNHHREVPTRLLHCDGALSAGDPNAGNLLVEGDNLEALKALLPYYAGKVKCIYIDPPYNTGSEAWVYNDNVNSPEIRAWLDKVVGKETEDLCRHDKWLCMMYPRLRLLSEFLSMDGVLFVSCDGNELPRLLEIGGEILSKRDAVVIPVVNNMKGRNDKSHVAQAHEYLVLFSAREFVASGLPLSEAQRKRFKYADNRGEKYELRDLRKRGGFDTREDRPNLFFEIYRTKNGALSLDEPLEEYTTIVPVKSDGDDGCWRWGKERVRRYLPFLESSFVKKTGRWNLNYRIYLNPEADPVDGAAIDDDSDDDENYDEETGDPIERSTKPKSFWWGPELSTDRAGKHLKAILGKKDFDYPKPVDLIWRVISMAGGQDCLVLDSFAGSGTTGEAVLLANKEDKQSRRFVLIEMDPKISKTVTAPRLTKVISGYTAKRSGGKIEDVAGLGGGFRYCTLGKPLFDEWGVVTEGVAFPDLAAFVFFSETGSPIPAKAKASSSLLGSFQDRAVHLLWSPDSVGVVSADAGNVLTPTILANLPKPIPDFAGTVVVYGEGCTVTPERLAAAGVTFKQIPYQVIGA